MLPERRTVGALLAHLAQAIPQQEAVVFPPRRLTHAALYAQATAVASGLWRLGIRHQTEGAPRDGCAALLACPVGATEMGVDHILMYGYSEGFLCDPLYPGRPS
jgi:hypothetical protein